MHLFSMFEFHFTKLPLRVENGSIVNYLVSQAVSKSISQSIN